MAEVTRTVVISDPVGLHARPASEFVQKVNDSGLAVTIAKSAGTEPVDGSSILSVLSLGVSQGDNVVLTVTGDNAEAVADDLQYLLEHQEG